MTWRPGLALLALAAAAVVRAQEVQRPVLLAPRGDSVFVYLLEQPPVLGGFVVYRSPVGSGRAAERVTREPVTAVREPALAAGMLGADLPAVMRAVRATDAAELLRRLRSDAFAGTVTSLLFRSVATVAGRLYVDGGLARGTEYEYRVVLTDGAGRETERRFDARVVVRDVAPAAPGAGRATPADREVSLGWTYPRFRGDPGDCVVGFHVYRAGGPGAAARRRLTSVPVLRNDAAPFVFEDRDVSNGAAYRYDVTAVDVLGRESDPSAVMRTSPADHTPPAVPTGLAAEAGDGVVQLVWRMSPEPDVEGYYVERSSGLSSPYTRLTARLVPATEPTWTDSTVHGGHPYFFRVIAVDSAGNASEPSNAMSALPVDRTPPAPPSGLVVAVERRRLVLSWSPSPSGDVRGYHVYRGDAPNRLVRLTSGPVAAVAFTDSGYGGAGLAPGGHYLVRVSAVDSSENESAQLEARVAVPDDEPPTPPTAFTARNVMARYVALAWASSSALDVRWYALTRAAGDSAPVEIGRFGPRDHEARDSAVELGQHYRYALTSIDSAGNRSAPATDSVTIRSLTPPAAPRLVTALAGADGVTVAWERSGSPDVTGYNVYRSPLPTGVFERVTRVPVAALRYTDPGAHPAAFYVVRAVDPSGNESAPGPAAQVVAP